MILKLLFQVLSPNKKIHYNIILNKKGDKRQQPTQCRCLNVYFLAFWLGEGALTASTELTILFRMGVSQ